MYVGKFICMETETETETETKTETETETDENESWRRELKTRIVVKDEIRQQQAAIARYAVPFFCVDDATCKVRHCIMGVCWREPAVFVRSSVLLLLLLLLRHVMDTSLPSCSRAVVWLSGSVYEGHCAVGSLRRPPVGG